MIKFSENYYDDVLKLIPLKPENIVVHYSLSARKAFVYVDQRDDIGAMVIQPNTHPPQLRLYLFNNKKWDLLKAYLDTNSIKLIGPCDSNLITHLENTNMISKYLKCTLLIFPENIKTCKVEYNQNVLPLTKDGIKMWLEKDHQNGFLKIGLEAVINDFPCFGYFIKGSPVHISTTYAVAGNYCDFAAWTDPKHRRKGYFKITSAYLLNTILSIGMIPAGISGNNISIRTLKSLGMEEYPSPSWLFLK